jgi:hypothetical protein
MAALSGGNVVATYTMIGGTRPVDNYGNIGTLNSASLTANFGTQSVSGNLSVSVAANTYAAGWSGNITPGTAKFSGGYADGFSLDVNGFFAGPSASRAGMAYTISTYFAYPINISGSVGFAK